MYWLKESIKWNALSKNKDDDAYKKWQYALNQYHSQAKEYAKSV